MDSPAIQQVPSFGRRILFAWCREWLVWALAWCIARGVLVVSFADVFGYGEEPEKACAAKAMLDGLPVPHYQLAYHYYEGGGFVVSHLDALAFALLGESQLAVKLVALALGAAVLWAGWRLCERLAGRAGARVFALLYVFAPASVQKLSLLALGIHFHALLFVALALDATARLIVEKQPLKRTWFELGIVAGFGFYFSYQLALTIVMAFAALAIALRRALFRKPAWFGALGFALGVSPLCWMAAHVGGEIFDIHGADFVGKSGGAKLELVRAFFASIFADRSALDLAALIVLCGAPLLGFRALLATTPRALRVGAWLVIAHIALFLLAYFAGGFTVGHVYHYFVLNRLTPLWWLAMLFTAIGAVAAWNSRRRPQRALAGLVVASLVSFGAIDMVRLVQGALATQRGPGVARLFAENMGILARTKCYVYPEYLRKIAPHVGGSSAERLRLFLHFREPLRDAGGSLPTVLHEGIAFALYGDGGRPLEEIQRELAGVDSGSLQGFYLGLGSLFRSQFPGNIAARVHALEVHPQPLRDTLIEAVGISGLGTLCTEDRIFEEVRQGLVADLPPAYFEGVGRRMLDARGMVTMRRYFEMTDGPWMLNRGRAEFYAASLTAPVGAALMRGFDAAHRDRWFDPAPWWLR